MQQIIIGAMKELKSHEFVFIDINNEKVKVNFNKEIIINKE